MHSYVELHIVTCYMKIFELDFLYSCRRTRIYYHIVTALDCRGRDGASGRREPSLYEANGDVPLGGIFNRVT